MAQLENVAEENVDDSNDFDIPDGLAGSKNPRIPTQRKTPEPIQITKRRGRPPNSRSKTNSIPSSTEKLWVEGAAVILSTTSALFASKVMEDKKYVMTAGESRAAAAGIVYVLFQYKQIREFALLVRTDSPTAILLKGFWPYLSRVFVKDIIENVILGLTIPQQPKSKSNGTRPDAGNNGQSNATGTPTNSINNAISWRDI